MDPSHYRALRDGAAVTDRSDRGLIAVRGDDRAGFLQGLLTNDVEALADGDGCYAAWLTPQGRMIADLDVVHAGDALLLDVDGGAADALLARLDALVFTEDVRLADLSRARASHGVHGPRAAQVLEQVTGASLRALPPNRGCAVTLGGAPGRVARTDALGIPGFHLFFEREASGTLRAALVAAGATPAGDEATEAVRIESGRPRFGVDMDTETIPLEAGIENRAISMDKGCYVGQEVIIRVLHRGQGRVAKRLVGLTLGSGADAAVPLPGTAVHHGGAAVGRVTSAVRSPAMGGVVGLGYVARALAEPGIEVAVGDGEGDARQVARVTRLPFVEPRAG
ncbi:MAG: folate-binding protein YgfZ [Acidobacteria bacterium]|nr:folate-binding protein YgfZ [Acidobacteriota bacterium]